jgi:hypothetical protein
MGGTLSRPLVRYLVHDPVERDSKHSYVVQLADLNAYAATARSASPGPLFPQTMWDELGPAIGADANEFHVASGLENPGIARPSAS